MSTVTLETLKADFDANRVIYLEELERVIFGWDDFERIMKRNKAFDADFIASVPSEKEGKGLNVERFVRSARLYVIARDYGLQAAMLFKLSDGAIDPRSAA